MSDRQDRIDAEIEACTGCGSWEFPKRSNCVDCIAAVDERIADEATINPRDATIERLRAELAASAEEHDKSALIFRDLARNLSVLNPKIPSDGNVPDVARCAAAARRAREGAER